MTIFANPMISDQLVACISSGRKPTLGQLFSQAEWMWIDDASGRSASAWSRLAPDSSVRLFALRNARVALTGDTDPSA